MRKRKISQPHIDFIEIINKVAEVSNISNFEYVIEIGYDDVDCFVGGSHKVIIKGFRGGVQIEKCVVIKWHPDPAYRACFRQAHLREIAYYNDIVPAFLEIQRKYDIIQGLRLKFPNCIYASTTYDKESTTVLIPFEEYQYFDRFRKMDLNHAMLVVKNLAKLHALSFALSKLNSAKFENIKNLFSKDVQYGSIEKIPKSLSCYFKASIATVNDATAKEKLKELIPNISLILNKCTKLNEIYSTICHADCWNNNLVFKYSGQRPVDSLLVDFQLARCASPVTDLSYFFYMSTDRSFLDEHYDRLLNLYYVTLSAVLKQCNLNIEEIYPKSVFQNHLNIYTVYGLLEALISMKIITAASEEAIKMTELRYLHPDEFLEYELENQNLYIERVNAVVDHFFARKYSLSDVLKN